MSMKQRALVIAVAMIAVGFAAAAATADPLTLNSTTFQDGKIMPKKVANNAENSRNNPNCVGDNVSPQFSWTNVPDGTKSFVFLMTDPEGRGGAVTFHWVAYGIPTTVGGFAEGEVSKLSDKYVAGKSTQGVGFYSGPCPPRGVMPHHYTFILIATDFDPTEMPPGLTHGEVAEKIAPNGGPSQHSKATAGLVGLFVNPWHE